VASVVWYTVLRVGLFFALWLPIQILTPLRGLWAIVIALLGSGVISVVVLNRQRNAMGLTVGNFFGRINERIEASTRAEDWPDSEAESEQEPEGERGHPGGLQDRDERGPSSAPGNTPDGPDRKE
jgi:hypothetical protein